MNSICFYRNSTHSLNGGELSTDYGNELLPAVEAEESPEVLIHLSKHELEQKMKQLKAIYHNKYGFRRKGVLYGNLSRGWSPEMLTHFFKSFPVQYVGVKRALLRQFFYGLRIGEVSSCTYEKSIGLVKVQTEKAGEPVVHFLPFIEGTEILFDTPVYSPNYLRNKFTQHCRDLGAPYYYSYTKDKSGKNRLRYTTHTLRKTAGNLVRKHTHDPFKEKVYLRQSIHRVWGATAHYMEYPEDEMRKDLNDAFSIFVEKLL